MDGEFLCTRKGGSAGRADSKRHLIGVSLCAADSLVALLMRSLGIILECNIVSRSFAYLNAVVLSSPPLNP